jgi:histidine ammonia-lyase
LINGTQFITALTTKALSHAKQLLHTAVVVTALSVAVLKGTSNAFDRRIHDLCPHKSFVAAAMRELLPYCLLVKVSGTGDKQSLIIGSVYLPWSGQLGWLS